MKIWCKFGSILTTNKRSDYKTGIWKLWYLAFSLESLGLAFAMFQNLWTSSATFRNRRNIFRKSLYAFGNVLTSSEHLWNLRSDIFSNFQKSTNGHLWKSSYSEDGNLARLTPEKLAGMRCWHEIFFSFLSFNLQFYLNLGLFGRKRGTFGIGFTFTNLIQGLDCYFRWHHVESTMNGGITTSVNFWYKVKFKYMLLTLWWGFCILNILSLQICTENTCFCAFNIVPFLAPYLVVSWTKCFQIKLSL